jgi:conjugal transfer pilus assembly protein TraW
MINPLDYVTLSKELLFVDGRDVEQVAWALTFERPLYFDQKGLLTRRFQIAAVPASVTQEGRRLRIREFPLSKKGKQSREDAR